MLQNTKWSKSSPSIFNLENENNESCTDSSFALKLIILL